MFKIAIGHTLDPDTEDAAIEIIDQCRTSLGDAKPQAGILFASVDYEYPIVLKEIHKAFPGIQLVGCTSGGELSSRLGYAQDSLLLVLFASDRISMASAVAREISKDIKASVGTAIAEVKQKLKEEPTFCLAFSDIFTIGTVKLVEELRCLLGSDFPIMGGGASDPWKFDQTREFYNEEVLQDSASLLFFAGPLEYSVNVGSGWVPFTSRKLVIDHDKNIALHIDGKKALDFFKDYLGSPPSLAYPLAVFEEGKEGFYLRVPLGVDEVTGTVTLGGDLPEKATVCVCQAEPADLMQAARTVMQEVTQNFPGSLPDCAIVITCSCRQRVLGTETNEEYNVIREVAPNIPMFGFYAYGQIAPHEKGSPSFVHNDSIMALLLREKKE